MTQATALPRKVVIFGSLVPLAILIGYALSQPLDHASIGVLVALTIVLSIPFLIGAHHLFLVAAWNASISVFFLPGQPRLWMLATLVTLSFGCLNRLLDSERKFISVPPVTWSLVSLAAVVVATMQLTGGIGLRSLGGGQYGGKRYVEILLAILGYFAFVSQRIPLSKAGTYNTWFWLSGMTAAMSNLIYMAGPGLWWFYMVFPVDLAIAQASADFSVEYDAMGLKRVSGIGFAALGPFMFMMARYGLSGLLDLTRPWRLVILLIIVAVGASAGFRSVLVIFGLVSVIQFYLEGLHRTRIFPVLCLVGLFGFAGVSLFANKLPLPIQRALSVLPLDVDPGVRQDAKYSSEWRVRMWKILLPDLPQYLFLGKGYALSPVDLYLTHQATLKGLSADVENSMVAGDYHSGPLSVYIPLGSPGLLAFLAFLVTGWSVLKANFRYGDPALRKINTFLLAFFVARVIFFFLIFGAISTDLYIFTGTIGLSVALNGGVARKPGPLPQKQPTPSLA